MNDIVDYKKYLISLKEELEMMVNKIQNINYNVHKDSEWNNIITIISGLRHTVHRELNVIENNSNLNPISLNIRFKHQNFESQMTSVRLTFDGLIKRGKKYKLSSNYENLY